MQLLLQGLFQLMIMWQTKWNNINNSTYQLVIVDIMVGQSIRIHKPMKDGDDIINICFTGQDKDDENQDYIVAYNSKYYR